MHKLNIVSDYNVSNILANYMATLLMADGRSLMRTFVWPDTFNAGIGLEGSDISGLSFQDESIRKTYIDGYNKTDEELKSILRANDMELEDLFLALAVRCSGHLECFIASNKQYDCCLLVRN